MVVFFSISVVRQKKTEELFQIQGDGGHRTGLECICLGKTTFLGQLEKHIKVSRLDVIVSISFPVVRLCEKMFLFLGNTHLSI